MMHWNVVLTIFHSQIICYHAWKTVRVTFWSITCRGICPTVFSYFFQGLFPAAIEEQRYRYRYHFLVFHTWLKLYFFALLFSNSRDCSWIYENPIFCQTQMARYNSIGHETAYFLWDIYAHDIITHIIAPLLFTSMVLIHQSKVLIYVNRHVDLYDFFYGFRKTHVLRSLLSGFGGTINKLLSK